MNGMRFGYRARDLRKAANMAAAEYRHKSGVLDSRVKVKSWTIRIEAKSAMIEPEEGYLFEAHGILSGIYLDVSLHVKLENTGVEHVATHTFNLYRERKMRAII